MPSRTPAKRSRSHIASPAPMICNYALMDYESHMALAQLLLNNGLLELKHALARWQVVADGPLFHTATSVMQRVYKQGEPAFLKVAMHAEERRGSALLRWWNGEGAVRVLAHSDTAMLLECACGGQSLANMSQAGHDAEASRIICKVVTQLHAHTGANPPEFMPLSQCFTALASAASAQELARTRF